VETRSRTSFSWQFQAAISIFLLGALTSCKSTSNIYESEGHSVSSIRTDIIRDARTLVGSTYQYAGKGPKKFDCSGLVGYVYGLSNINVGGSSSSLASQGEKISTKELRPGDLIFFKNEGRVFHVSLVSRVKSDEIWVVHSTTSRGVIEENIMASRYWRPLIHKTVSLNSYR